MGRGIIQVLPVLHIEIIQVRVDEIFMISFDDHLPPVEKRFVGVGIVCLKTFNQRIRRVGELGVRCFGVITCIGEPGVRHPDASARHAVEIRGTRLDHRR